ncbi:hypothetical protein A2U01_0061776, partial [Trifolium medium]|nr:hypothetical protein [Trifolium medium]
MGGLKSKIPITMEVFSQESSPSRVAEGRTETVTKEKMETVCGDEETTLHIVKDGEEQTGEAIIGRCPANGSSGPKVDEKEVEDSTQHGEKESSSNKEEP